MKVYYAKNKETIKKKNAEWREKNRDRRLTKAREYHWKNREKLLPLKREYSKRTKEKRAAYLRMIKYGLTDSLYDEMLTIQNGVCASCKINPAIVVDHDHSTGKVRGILCSQCNTSLGLLKEDPDLIGKLLEYCFLHGGSQQ